MKNKLSQSITWADLRILLATLVIIAAFFISVGYYQKGLESNTENDQEFKTDVKSDIKDIKKDVSQIALDVRGLTDAKEEGYRRRNAGEVTKATSSAYIAQNPVRESKNENNPRPTPEPTPQPSVTQTIIDNILGFLR